MKKAQRVLLVSLLTLAFFSLSNGNVHADEAFDQNNTTEQLEEEDVFSILNQKAIWSQDTFKSAAQSLPLRNLIACRAVSEKASEVFVDYSNSYPKTHTLLVDLRSKLDAVLDNLAMNESEEEELEEIELIREKSHDLINEYKLQMNQGFDNIESSVKNACSSKDKDYKSNIDKALVNLENADLKYEEIKLFIRDEFRQLLTSE